MPSIQAPFAGLNYGWTLGESNWNTGMDANLVMIDFLMQPTITSYLATPPASPTDGSAYLVAASPTGDWAGKAQNIALRVAGAWVFLTAKNGWRVFSLATGTYWRFTGTVWINTMAVTADAQAATSATLCASPAGVREFMEQYGFTSSYINTASDLNAVTGSTDRNVTFAFSASTLNIPVAGQYGRGFQFASGGNYTTQVAWINGSIDQYIRFNNGGTWTAWSKTAYNANDLVSTPWTSAVLQNGWLVIAGSRAVFRKALGRVFVELGIQNGAYSDGTVLFQLPASSRPVVAVLAPTVVKFNAGTSVLPPRLGVTTEGLVKVYGASSSDALYALFSFDVS